MLDIDLKHTVATVAVALGLLSATGTASAVTPHTGVVYNGHAGLGASIYQHDQSDLEFGANDALTALATDGTSNTLMIAERSSGHLAADGRGVDPILMTDMGGQ